MARGTNTLDDAHRILFIGGLHRSGTTPVARWIAQHPDVSAFEGTHAAEDEGQHLQDVYPTASQHGGPGRFALDDDAHLTESSSLVSDAARERIWQAWSPYWDLERPVLLEKSPPNLIRTRFLQALFPRESHFLVVIRHPIAVAYATRRWTRRSAPIPWAASRRLTSLQAPIGQLLEHWIVAHERFIDDASSLQKVRLVRYEDVVAETAPELAAIFRFVGLEPLDGRWEVKTGLNSAYIRRWESWRRSLGGRRAVGRIYQEFEPRLRRFGYSLREPEEAYAPAPDVARYVATR